MSHKNSEIPPLSAFSGIPPGWLGGFAESNPAFAYPDPDLTSLPMYKNMDNIDNIKRQLLVWWPEFSWLTNLEEPDSSRCFEMFANDISSIGYDDYGRIWSIICPQQGVCLSDTVCLNVEVTVTGQRGWVNEIDKTELADHKLLLAADMTVQGKIWFSESSVKNYFLKRVWQLFENKSLPFPNNKDNAIVVSTHKVGDPNNPIFTIRAGESERFEAPDFARHQTTADGRELAYGVGHIDVEIGGIVSKNHHAVDTFNKKVLDLFNMASGNMLLAQNVLTWNLWFLPPELVNTNWWRNHAETWRTSIDVDHGHPSSPPFYADGSPFKPHMNFDREMLDIVGLIEELILGR